MKKKTSYEKTAEAVEKRALLEFASTCLDCNKLGEHCKKHKKTHLEELKANIQMQFRNEPNGYLNGILTGIERGCIAIKDDMPKLINDYYGEMYNIQDSKILNKIDHYLDKGIK